MTILESQNLRIFFLKKGKKPRKHVLHAKALKFKPWQEGLANRYSMWKLFSWLDAWITIASQNRWLRDLNGFKV